MSSEIPSEPTHGGELTAAKLIALQLVEELQPSGSTDSPTSLSQYALWSVDGFSAQVVNAVVPLLTAWPNQPLIKIDAAYEGDLDASAAIYQLNPELESLTQFRHVFNRPRILLRRSADGGEWESLESTQQLTPDDLQQDLPQFISRLPAAESIYSAREREMLEGFLNELATFSDLTLKEQIDFLQEIHRWRTGGEPLNAAFGLSLPALGVFRDRQAFSFLGEQRDLVKLRIRTRKTLRDVVVSRRPFPQRCDRNWTPLDPDMLADNLEQAVKDEHITAEVAERLRPFTRPQQLPEDPEILELDWQIDAVSELFGRPRAKTESLAERTRQFFEFETDLELTPDEVALLGELENNSSSPSPALSEPLRGFYEQYESELSGDRKLKEGWRKLLFRRKVNEPDFLYVLVRAVDDLIGENLAGEEADYDATLLPLRLHVEFKDGPTLRLIEQKNCDAIAYFLARYRGLHEALGECVDLDLKDLAKIEDYLTAWAASDKDDEQAIPEAIREEFSEFVRKSRRSKVANSLVFRVWLVSSTTGEPVSRQREVTWTFAPGSFLSGFADDLDLHAKQPMRCYRLTRSQTSSKGIRPPVALEDAACVQNADDRESGRLVPDGADDAMDVFTEVAEAFERLEVDGALSPADAEQGMQLVQELTVVLQELFGGFREFGLNWDGWEVSASKLADLNEQLIGLSSVPRYGRDVLARLAVVGIALVADGSGTDNDVRLAIVSPLHPLRLLVLFIKTAQVRDLLEKWLGNPGVELLDRGEFVAAIGRDLAHAAEPEVVPYPSSAGGENQLLATTATLGDYTLLTPADDTQCQSGRGDDPTMAVRLLRGVLEDFLTLHPAERDNLSVLTHSVASERFPALLLKELGRNDRQWAGVRSRLYLRDTDDARLRRTYRSFLRGLEDSSGLSDADVSFLARLGVHALDDPDDFHQGDIDVAFLLDHVAERSKVVWRPVSELERPASLREHRPSRWSRRRVQDPGSGAAGSYLVCPSQPRVGATYLELTRRVLDGSEGESGFIPVREADVTSDPLKTQFEEAHRSAQWVVNLDSVLDRRQLRQLGVQVIRYRPSSQGRQNLLVSSGQPDVLVHHHLRKRIEELDPGLLHGNENLIERILSLSADVSGELLLRTAGRGALVHELLGVLLSRQAALARLPEVARRGVVWVYLDDYASWFLERADLAGDLEKALEGGRNLADLLGIAAWEDDEGPQLRILVTEAKFLTVSENLKFQAETSKTQLRATLRRVSRGFAEHGELDVGLWRDRLANLILEAAVRSHAEGAVDPERLAEWIRRGGLRPTIEGHSHVFVIAQTGNPQTETLPTGLENTTTAWQHIIPREPTLKLLRSLLDEPPFDLCTQDNGPSGDEPPHGGTSQFNTTVNSTSHQEQTNEPKDRDAGGRTSSAATGTSGTTNRETDAGVSEPLETGGEASIAELIQTNGFDWAEKPVAKLLHSLDETAASVNPVELQAQTERIESILQEFLPTYGIRTRFGDPVVTPNAFRIRLAGEHDLTADKLRKLADALLTVKRLRLLRVETEPGYFALSFERRPRQPVSFLDLIRERQVTELGANTRVRLGRQRRHRPALRNGFRRGAALARRRHDPKRKECLSVGVDR